MRYIRRRWRSIPALPVPIYQQLKTLLVDGILERRYTTGDRLPTEHELCEIHGISRTPVNRALSELAAEGVILRHRRRGSFVNPQWLGRRRGDSELRVVVPAYGPWEQLVRDAADGGDVNIVRAARDVTAPRAHATPLPRARRPTSPCSTTSGRPSSRGAGFLHPLEDLDPRWVRREHDVDFLASLAAADRYGGQTFGVLGVRRGRRCCGSTSASLRASTSMRRRRGASCSAARGACGRPSRVTRWRIPGGTAGGETTAYCLIGLPRLQRRQRASRTTARQSARPRAPKRCVSCAGWSPTSVSRRPPSVTRGIGRSTSSPTVRRR